MADEINGNHIELAKSVIRKATPTLADVHVNALLTNLCVAYFQSLDGFVADKVFPSIPTDKQANYFPIWNSADFNRDQMRKRAPSTETAGGGIAPTTDTYFCEVRGFHVDIDDQLQANADAQFRMDQAIAKLLTLVDLICREVTFASSYFTTGIWTTNKTGGSDFTVWDDESSNPLKDVEDAKNYMLERTGFEPNTLVLGKKVYSVLRRHPDLVDRIKAGQTPNGPAILTSQNLQQLFEIERILVMKAIQNTAAEGQTASNSFIGGNHALLTHSNSSGLIMFPSAGYTFNWSGYTGAGENGVRIKSFRMENLNSTRQEVESAWAMKKVSADLGYFFSGAVSEVGTTSTT